MRQYKYIILLLCSIINNNVIAQFNINWQQSYGGSEAEVAVGIVPCTDGYLLAGTTESNDGQVTCNDEEYKSWLIKINHQGEIIQQWCYGDQDVYSMGYQKGSRNLYLIGGAADPDFNLEVVNPSVIKVDSMGTELWRTCVGPTLGMRYDNGGIVTNDGGTLAYAQIGSGGGDVTNYYSPYYNAWLAKISSEGELQWDCTFGNSTGSTIATSITELSDGRYIVCLYGDAIALGNGNVKCQVETNGIPTIILYFINSDGTSIEQWCYNGSNHDYGAKVLELEDGFLLVESTMSNDGDMLNSGYHGKFDVWIARLDFSGNIIWQKCYGGSNDDIPNDISKTSDGGFMIFANTESWDCDVVGNIPDEDPSIWIFKINGDGDLIWQQPIRGDGFEGCHGVVKINDDKYVMAGYMSLSPSYDVVCSNFVPLSYYNFYALEIEVTYVGDEIYFQDSMIKLYPNPATDEITVELAEKISNTPVSIDIINMTGSVLQHHEQFTCTKTYNIEMLPEGLYIIRMENKKCVSYIKLIVK
jgi:hypothetical protein